MKLVIRKHALLSSKEFAFEGVSVELLDQEDNSASKGLDGRDVFVNLRMHLKMEASRSFRVACEWYEAILRGEEHSQRYFKDRVLIETIQQAKRSLSAGACEAAVSQLHVYFEIVDKSANLGELTMEPLCRVTLDVIDDEAQHQSMKVLQARKMEATDRVDRAECELESLQNAKHRHLAAYREWRHKLQEEWKRGLPDPDT